MRDFTAWISRRRAFALAGGAAGIVAAPRLAASAVLPPTLAPPARPGLVRVDAPCTEPDPQNGLPVEQIKNILPGESSMTATGLLDISFGRKDLGKIMGPGNTPKPTIPYRKSFQINTEFYFQALPGNRAIMNGDMALLPHELNPVIKAILQNGLVFQAEHQHFYNLHPMLFFIHLRGIGEPIALAHAIRNVLSVTATPLNQQSASKPTPPFDMQRLENILGAKASLSSDGVISVLVPRRNQIMLGGVPINPGLNVMTSVAIQPVPSGSGGPAAVSPDFSMIAGEVDRVAGVMERQGWQITCLYNQETDEHPQLFFSHQVKVGDPYQLAQEVRNGLDQTDVQGSPMPRYTRYTGR